MRTKLTKRSVEAIDPPATGSAAIIWDTEATGFYVRVSVDADEPTGARRTYYFYGRTKAGRQGRLAIGRHGSITVDQARDAAQVMAGQIAAGGDPFADRRDARGAEAERQAAPTMDDLCDRYLEEHAKVRKRPGPIAGDRRMIGDRKTDPLQKGRRRRYPGIIRPRLGSKRVADVTRDDIERLHREKAGTPYAANRLLALLSKMMVLAVSWRLRSDNPCKGIERFREDKRERFLSDAELVRLQAALKAHPNRNAVDAIRLMLLTGVRKGEALRATFGQFELQANTGPRWTMVASYVKQRKLHVIPLAPAAVDLVGELRRGADARIKDRVPRPDIAGLYLFPGRKPGAHLADVKGAWREICQKAEIAPGPDGRRVRVHDLRHSYASLLVNSGLSLPIIGRLLGHTQPGTTARYAHVDDAVIRAATEAVADRLKRLERKPAKVTPLRPKPPA